MPREDLLSSNHANVLAHAQEIEKEVAKEIEAELRETLEKTFRGHKSIRLK